MVDEDALLGHVKPRLELGTFSGQTVDPVERREWAVPGYRAHGARTGRLATGWRTPPGYEDLNDAEQADCRESFRLILERCDPNLRAAESGQTMLFCFPSPLGKQHVSAKSDNRDHEREDSAVHASDLFDHGMRRAEAKWLIHKIAIGGIGASRTLSGHGGSELTRWVRRQVQSWSPQRPDSFQPESQGRARVPRRPALPSGDSV